MHIIESNGTKQNSFAVFGLLFGACFWGVVWYPYRLLQDAGVSGVASSFYTYVIAIAIAGLLFIRQWRGLIAQPKSIIWLSIAAGWTNLSYVLAVIDGEVVRVILLFYLSPLWTLILAHFWLKERTDAKGLLVIIVSLLGSFVMFYDHAQAHMLPLPRNHSEWLALSAGIGFATTNVITRKSVHLSIRAKSFAIWLGVIAVALFCIPFSSETFVMPQMLTQIDWLIMTLIALALVIATLLVQYGLTQLRATRASVIFLFELVVAAVASYFLAGEITQWNEWLGGSLIVAAALYSATQDTAPYISESI